MKLKNIKIENFRSIKSLELHITDTLYCLIGKNEIGKSNILQAVATIGNTAVVTDVNAKQKINRGLAVANITADFEPTQNERKVLQTILKWFKPSQQAAPFQIPNDLNTRFSFDNIKFIRVNSKKNLDAQLDFSIVLKDDVIFKKSSLSDPIMAKEFQSAIEGIIPSIEYYEREDFLIKPTTPEEIMQNPDDPSLQSFKRLFSLGGLDDVKRLASTSVEEVIEIKESVSSRLNELLRKYYKQDTTLNVRIESHNGHYSLHFKDAYHRLNSLEDRSTGFQYFFAFLINKIYLKEFRKKHSVYLLDEPALSLHPTGQKDFIKLLEEISIENQIIYTTHSPFSINRMKPTRVWVIEKSIEKGTYINPKPYQKNWRPLRSALGIDVSDSFFYGDRSLLVEGPEDRIYIGALFNIFSLKGDVKLNSDLLSIIDSGSISNMPAMVQILLDEERPLFVFMDDDDTHVYNRLKKKEQEIQNPDRLTILKTSDIFKEAISIEDLMPHDLYIQAVKNYLEFLLKEGTIIYKSEISMIPQFDFITSPKKYQQIGIEIKKQFKNSDGSELDSRTPISKVGVAHEFEKLLNPEKKIGSDQEEKNCLQLVQMIIAKLGL